MTAVTALACDGNGDIYASRGRLSAILRLPTTKGNETAAAIEVIVGPTVVRAPILALVVSRSEIYALTPYLLRGNSNPFIHTFGKDGSRIAGFGQDPDSEGSADSGVAQRILLRTQGSLMWNDVDNVLVFAPSAPYEFHRYTPEGTHLKTVDRGDPDFGSAGVAESEAAMPGRGNEVFAAIRLPTGEYLTYVIKRTTANRIQREDPYLEVLDADFRIVRTRIPLLGYPQGAAADGSIYFTMIGQRGGINVIKARLPVG